ncbi:MAG TPA: pyridoxine 5'-phosphate synthase [Myxococcota bacterium]|nr:pyridoxine 5'-phosphate synthase [Myxococcota bacterium]
MSGVKLSVNVNKYALLRNSRGHDTPNLIRSAAIVLQAGAHGITVHPRRDQRHVRYDDLAPLAAWLRAEHPTIELNVECENHPEIVEQVLALEPDQCTLVPVRPGEVTSDHGYRFPDDHADLAPTLWALRGRGIRSSIFMDCDDPAQIAGAARVGADRVELYTGPYAWAWGTPEQARRVDQVFKAAETAVALGLEVNAGHDLDRHNLAGLRGLPGLAEVSIGHAQICRALEVGTAQSVRELLAALDGGA